MTEPTYHVQNLDQINTVLEFYNQYQAFITEITAHNQWTLPVCDNTYLQRLNEKNITERQQYLDQLRRQGTNLETIENSIAKYLQNIITQGPTPDLLDQIAPDIDFRLRNHQYAYLKLAIWQGNLDIVKVIISIVEFIDHANKYVYEKKGINPFSGKTYDLNENDDSDESVYSEDSESSEIFDESLESESTEDLNSNYFEPVGDREPPDSYYDIPTFKYHVFCDAELLSIACRESANMEVINYLLAEYNKIVPDSGELNAISNFTQYENGYGRAPQYWPLRFALKNNNLAVLETLILELGIFTGLRYLLSNNNEITENNVDLGRAIINYLHAQRNHQGIIALLLESSSSNRQRNSTLSILNKYQGTQGLEDLQQMRTIILAAGEGYGERISSVLKNKENFIAPLMQLMDNKILSLNQSLVGQAGPGTLGIFGNNDSGASPENHIRSRNQRSFENR
ncbi:MAG: hypothetical protein WC627_11775 [Legionella sp.]|jgi:hypothetical protein